MTRSWSNLGVVASGLAVIMAIGCGSVLPGPGQGSLRQNCYANQTCNTGLSCVSGVCVDLDGGLIGAGGTSAGGSTGTGGAGGLRGAAGSTGTGGQPCTGPSLVLCGGSCVASNAQHCGTNCITCPGGDICDSSGMCASSCGSGSSMCSDGACSSNSDSAHCGTTCSVCGSGSTCNNGLCGCSVSGQQLCGSTCIDTTSNTNSCGSCGHACSSGQTCSNGACISTNGTGGTTGTGGKGGSPGTGGSTGVTCTQTFDATTGGWVTAPAAGGTCWHGYAYNFADAYGTTITPGTAMTYATCGMPCSLTATGTVAIATTANNYATYAGIGFSIDQPVSGGSATPTLAPAGSSLTVSFAASTGGLSLRAVVSDGTTNWCYTITGSSPVTIPYASFNTKCYDTPADGTAYAKTPISSFQIEVAGGPTSSPYSIALTGLTENN